MKCKMFIIVSCFMAVAVVLLLTMCGGTTSTPEEPGGSSDIVDLPAGTSTVELDSGVKLTITSPVALQYDKNPDPSSYPAGSKVNPISLICALAPGQTIDVSYYLESGFNQFDAIIYVDAGAWTPLTTTLSADQKTLSATIEDSMVKSLSKNSSRSTSIIVGVKSYIDPPTGVTASDGTYTDRILIQWDQVAGASSY